MTGKLAGAGMPENWACARITEMLEKQQNPRRIARDLPNGPGVRWGSKAGSLDGVTDDAGFITTAQGTMIIGVFCEDLPDQRGGEPTIGAISRAAQPASGLLVAD